MESFDFAALVITSERRQSIFRKALVSLLLIFPIVQAVSAQCIEKKKNQPSTEARQQDKFPRGYGPLGMTLTGPSGLFLTYEADTLIPGECRYNFSFNQLTLDPGQVRVRQIPTGVSAGISVSQELGNRLELFANFNALQNTHIGRPQTLSGVLLRNALLNTSTTLRQALRACFKSTFQASLPSISLIIEI